MARPVLDQQLLAAAYGRDARRLLVWLTRRTYDAQQAVDLVGETYARAWESRHRFAGDPGDADALAAWTWGIARHVLADALRRDRATGDDLPANALQALRDRGLEPFDPAAARLLRTTDHGGRAWVVPVHDAATALTRLGCLAGALRQRVPNVHPVPAPAPSTAKRTPEPGLAIVAVGGAPVGAGGTLGDLVRGREPVAVDPCAGPSHDMLSVSGIAAAHARAGPARAARGAAASTPVGRDRAPIRRAAVRLIRIGAVAESG